MAFDPTRIRPEITSRGETDAPTAERLKALNAAADGLKPSFLGYSALEYLRLSAWLSYSPFSGFCPRHDYAWATAHLASFLSSKLGRMLFRFEYYIERFKCSFKI